MKLALIILFISLLGSELHFESTHAEEGNRERPKCDERGSEPPGWNSLDHPVDQCTGFVCDPDYVYPRGDTFGRVKRDASKDEFRCKIDDIQQQLTDLNSRPPFKTTPLQNQAVKDIKHRTTKDYAAYLLLRNLTNGWESISDSTRLNYPLMGVSWVIKVPGDLTPFFEEEFYTLDHNVEARQVLEKLSFRIPLQPPTKDKGFSLAEGYSIWRENDTIVNDFACKHALSRIQEINAIINHMTKTGNFHTLEDVDASPDEFLSDEDPYIDGHSSESEVKPMTLALIGVAIKTIGVIAFFLSFWCAAVYCQPKESHAPSLQQSRMGKAGPSGTMAAEMGMPMGEKSKKKK